jgi:hypothetical protein
MTLRTDTSWINALLDGEEETPAAGSPATSPTEGHTATLPPVTKEAAVYPGEDRSNYAAGHQFMSMPATENLQKVTAILNDEATRRRQEQQRAMDDWRSTYNDFLSGKANLYKAHLGAAEAKRKEAKLKSYISALGTLIDGINVAHGGTVTMRDFRNDIYSSRQQADNMERQERAAEQTAFQKYYDRLSDIFNRRPAYEKNDALLQLAGIYADRDKFGWQAWQAMERYKSGLDSKEREGEKNRQSRERIAAGKEHGPKESELVRIPLSDGQQIMLPKGIWHSAALEKWISEIYSDQRFDEDSRSKIREALQIIGEMDNKQKQEAELGKLLHDYPEFARIMAPYDVRHTNNPAPGIRDTFDDDFSLFGE